MRFPAPNPPYKGPPANHGGPINKPIHRVVIHETQGECVKGAAAATAAYFRNTTRDASAHYVVDPATVVQATLDSYVAYHAPPNLHSLGVEICGVSDPKSRARFRRGTGNREALERAQLLVAQLCLAYDVPPWFQSAKSLRAGKRGVTTHAEVSKAWGQSSHWDPGAWPRYWFMRGVRAHVRRIRKGVNR